MENVRLLEITAQNLPADSIDSEGGVIRDCVIMTAESKNRRRYTEQAMAQIVEFLRQSPKALINHAAREGGTRSANLLDLCGRWDNVRLEDGKVKADLRPLSAFRDRIITLAKEAGDLFGVSIDALGQGAYNNAENMFIVDAVTGCYSADLVLDPAATSNLFESLQQGELEKMANEITLKEAQEYAKLVEQERDALKTEVKALKEAAAKSARDLALKESLRSAGLDAEKHFPFVESLDDAKVSAYVSEIKSLTEARKAAPPVEEKNILAGATAPKSDLAELDRRYPKKG